jgi:YYY domain-containing protein
MEYALVLRWLVLYAALFAAGLPLVARLLPGTRGRGAGLAVPAATLVLTVPAYWVGQVAFGLPALLAGVVVLLVASALAAADHDALRAGRLELGVDVPRRAVGDAAVVFGLSFAFLLVVRAFDPGVFPIAGEKFLDFGLLKSLRRAPTLPPEDLWFAGEAVKYYYGGHLVTTLFAWLTATPTRFAYNLALAGFYATLVTAAFELAATVGEDHGLSRRVSGAFAAFFVGFASNLVTAGRFALVLLPEGLRRPAAQMVAARTDYTVSGILEGAAAFSYWDASRVIPGTINEFPLFAWLNGDLHAHMTGTPFLLLAAAVGYAYYRTPETEVRRRRLLLSALPVVAGWQAIHNTWSFPSALALGTLAVVFAPAAPWTLVPGLADAGDRLAARSRPAEELTRVGVALGVTVAGGVVALAVAAPFFLGTAVSGSERTVELLGPEMRSSLGGLLLVHGAFVAAFGAYLLSRLRVRRPVYLVVGLLAAAYVGLGVGLAALAISVPLLVFGWVALRSDRPVGYETVLVVAGAGLVTLVELVYLNEQAGPGRMNTVFKTYMQVWVLWATAMGVALPGLIRGVPTAARVTARVRDAAPSVATDGAGARSWRRVAAVAFACLLVASTGVYGVVAVGNHVERGPPGGTTLDATQFVETSHPEYAEAIDWLDEREGTPVLLEAPGTSFYASGTDGREDVMYNWNANPASSLTGLPTVAGWAHEVGYRGPDAYYGRVADVDAMYTGDAATRARLLREYDVRYVWVGPGERARYGDVSFEMQGVSVAHRSGSVTVYEVTQERLPAANGSVEG